MSDPSGLRGPADDGTLISERFTLGELLGSGGSASVFAATDLTTGVDVALKILHPHLSDAPETREAFFRQARAASIIRHPNVAGVVALGTDLANGLPVAWIAFERANGVSLTERVERFGALDVGDTFAVAEGMLRGVGAAHAAGVVHRDLSPGNIMVPANGPIRPENVRIIDFGLADAAGRPVVGVDIVRTAGEPATNLVTPAEPGVLGTVNYLSPEQARGEAVDEGADLYQIAAVLYFALTGRPPYQRDSAEETMRAHLHAPPPVPSSVRAGVPRELDRLVVKGMLKSRQSRFASAEEMLHALRPGLEHQPAASAVGVPGGAATKILPTQVPTPATALTQVLTSPSSARRSLNAAGRASAARTSAASAPLGRRAPTRRPARSGWATGVSVAALAVVLGGFIAAAGSSASPPLVAPTRSASSAPSEAAPSESPVPQAEQHAAEAEVPVLAQLTLAAARSALVNAGLSLGTVSSEDSAFPEGTVIGASEPAGERVEAGRVVDLVVASGWNRVPSLVGLGLAEASAGIVAAGFTVTVVTPPDGGTGTSGPETVTSAEPAAGTRIPLGRRILVQLTAGTSTLTPTPAPSASPGHTPAPTATPTVSPTAPQPPTPTAP